MQFTSGLSILMHGIISPLDTTLNDKEHLILAKLTFILV